MFWGSYLCSPLFFPGCRFPPIVQLRQQGREEGSRSADQMWAGWCAAHREATGRFSPRPGRGAGWRTLRQSIPEPQPRPLSGPSPWGTLKGVWAAGREHFLFGDTRDPSTLLAGTLGESWHRLADAWRGYLHVPGWARCPLSTFPPQICPELKKQLGSPRLVHTQKYIIISELRLHGRPGGGEGAQRSSGPVAGCWGGGCDSRSHVGLFSWHLQQL